MASPFSTCQRLMCSRQLPRKFDWPYTLDLMAARAASSLAGGAVSIGVDGIGAAALGGGAVGAGMGADFAGAGFSKVGGRAGAGVSMPELRTGAAVEGAEDARVAARDLPGND